MQNTKNFLNTRSDALQNMNVAPTPCFFFLGGIFRTVQCLGGTSVAETVINLNSSRGGAPECQNQKKKQRSVRCSPLRVSDLCEQIVRCPWRRGVAGLGRPGALALVPCCVQTGEGSGGGTVVPASHPWCACCHKRRSCHLDSDPLGLSHHVLSGTDARRRDRPLDRRFGPIPREPC